MFSGKGLETSSTTSPRCKQSSLASLLTIAVLIALQGTADSECPMDKGEDLTLGEMVYYSDVAILGTVLRHVEEPSTPKSLAAEVEIHCIYKGAPLPAKLNISEADFTVDGCQTNYTVDSTVIAYLQRADKGVYHSKYRENPEQYADEILSVCNISVTWPLGVDPGDDAKEGCKLLDDGPCLSMQPTTKRPVIVPTGKTPPPSDGYPEPEDASSDKEVPYDRSPDVGAVEDEDEEDYGDNGSVVVRMPWVLLVIASMSGVILFS